MPSRRSPSGMVALGCSLQRLVVVVGFLLLLRIDTAYCSIGTEEEPPISLQLSLDELSTQAPTPQQPLDIDDDASYHWGQGDNDSHGEQSEAPPKPKLLRHRVRSMDLEYEDFVAMHQELSWGMHEMNRYKLIRGAWPVRKPGEQHKAEDHDVASKKKQMMMNHSHDDHSDDDDHPHIRHPGEHRKLPDDHDEFWHHIVSLF